MAVVIVKNVKLDIPREAAGLILELAASVVCDATPSSIGLKMGLYTNDIVVDEETVYTDFDIAANALGPVDLNPAADCTDSIEGPALNPDEWALTFDQRVFVNDTPPGPTTIYGVLVYQSSSLQLLGAIRFDEPANLPEDDDTLKVTAQLVLLPQVTAVLP